MGLRDFMTGVQSFNQGLSDLSTMRSAQDKINSEVKLADYIRQKYGQEQGDAYQNAAAAGDKLAQASILSQLMPKSNAAGGLITDTTQAQLAAPGASQEEIAALTAMKDAKAQGQALKGLTAKYNQGQINTRLGTTLSATEAQRGQQQSTKAFDVLNKTKDAFRSEEATIKQINDAVKNKTSVDDALVFNFVARNVANEKGPLSNDDINRIRGITGFQGTAEEMKSYFTGGNYSKLSDEQRSAIKDVVNRAASAFENRRASAYAQDLNDLYHSQSKLQDKSGNPTGIIKSTLDEASKAGIPVEFDSKTKTFQVKTTKHTAVGDVEASLLRDAAATKDTKLMNDIGTALSALKKQGKQLTPEQEANLRKLIQSRIGQ